MISYMNKIKIKKYLNNKKIYQQINLSRKQEKSQERILINWPLIDWEADCIIITHIFFSYFFEFYEF